MSGIQQGHYSPADIQWFVEHDSMLIPLAEIENGGVSWDFDPMIEPAGKGLGILKNSYYKMIDAPKGSGKISRAHLDRGDNGMLFVDLAQGDKYIIQEAIAASSATYTVSQNTGFVGIIEIRLTTSNVVLREAVDYTVNYVTGAITFVQSTPEAGVIRYQSTARKNQNLLINGGFEDALGSTWIAVATATIARNTANAYVEGNALGVTPTATNDGVQYNVTTNLQPGRTYRLRLKAKAAAAETLVAKWNDGTTDQSMTGGATLTTTFATYEFTFTATKAQAANIKILDSKVSPALFYIDEVALLDDTSGSSPSLGVNPMDAGLAVTPFVFNLVGKRVPDGAIIHRLMKCAVDKTAFKSGNAYQEAIDFLFLDYIGQ